MATMILFINSQISMAALLEGEGARTVVFNARFCGRKTAQKERTIEPTDVTDNKVLITAAKNKVFNIKRARYEVMRYGMSGFDKEQQKNQKIAMAIRLGAKPPKKKCVNYKELMEEKKKEKECLKTERRSRYNLQPLKQSRKSSEKKKLKNNLQPLKQSKKSSKKKKLKNQPNSIV